VPFTARRGFKLTVAVKMGKLLKVMQKVRMLACGGNEEYNDLGDANMWGDVSDAVKSASSSVSSVATAVGKEAKKVSDTVSGSLLNIHGKLIRATILKYAGENNLGFICAVSSTTLSASAPTVIFLPKTSSNSSKTEDPIPHGNSLTSKMVLVARKLSSKRECPMCDKKATKGSAVEKWMPSTSKHAPYIQCEAVLTIQLVRCSTCCCSDGLIKSSVSAALVYKAEGADGAMCGSWFATADSTVRGVITSMRVLQYAMYIVPTCFIRNKFGTTGARGKRELKTAGQKCPANVAS